MAQETVHIYVNQAAEDGRCFRTIGMALQAMEEMAPLSQKVKEALEEGKQYPAQELDVAPVVIHIAPGVYREQLVVERPNVTFLGEDAENTVIVYGLSAFEVLENGEKRGTFRTASVRIDAQDFNARNITFSNDAGFGHTVGQALALYVDGDRCCFENCRFLGSQDTLFTAPLPLKEAQPGGFRGPGEFKPRILGRHYYKNCFIQGDVDFIFGGGICYFENCTLYSRMPEDRGNEQNKDMQTTDGQNAGSGKAQTTEKNSPPPVYGYVTAASTPEGQPFGYVFENCRLTSNCPEGTVYLGRPWREFAKTVFLRCYMGSHIHPEGWKDWGKPHGHFYYGEYGCYGPGAVTDQRVDFSHQLTEKEAAEYTREQVLGNWVP